MLELDEKYYQFRCYVESQINFTSKNIRYNNKTNII